MATSAEEGFVYIGSAMWKGVSPAPRKNTKKHDMTLTLGKIPDGTPSTNASTRKIQWKRPVAPDPTADHPSADLASISGSNSQMTEDSLYLANTKLRATASVVSTRPAKARQPERRSSSKKVPAKPKIGAITTDQVHTNDPYSMPLSPISSRRQTETAAAVKSERMHPKSGITAISSPTTGSFSVKNEQNKRGNQKRIPKRSILDPPEMPDEESTDIPVEAKPNLTLDANLNKREARKKMERTPIAVPSDSGNSTGEGMHCDDEAMSVPQPRRPHVLKDVNILRKSTSRDAPNTTDEELHAVSTKAEQPKIEPKQQMPVTNRGRVKASVSAHRTRTREIYKKRGLSPTTKLDGIREDKRPKIGPPHVMNRDIGMERPEPLRAQERPNVSRPMSTGDPFCANKVDVTSTPTDFIAKLLNTAAQVEYTAPIRHQAQPMTVPTRLFLHQGIEPQGHIEPSGIAKQMMQAFKSAGSQHIDNRSRTPQGNIGCESAKDVWLNQADPYKETSHIMSYVCTTILRFLKSKETAIDDVANEYLQRGEVVIKNIRALHDDERTNIVKTFEGCRLQALRIFEEAQHDIHALSNKLGCINVASAVSDMLTDDTVSSLRALQAKIV